MADNSFRGFRRGANAPDAEAASDPLAELARLIGQSEAHGGAYGGRGPEFRQSAEAFDDNAPASELDWGAADDDYADGRNADRDYASRRSADPDQPYPSDELEGWPRDRNDEEPASGRGYAPPVPGYGDARVDARSSRAHSTPYIPPGEAGDLQVGDQAQDDYEEPAARPRRSGTIVIIAVIGLAVLGTAGALGYRAMFGGSIIPSLPPIIKPGNTPVKIVPDHESQTRAPSQADAKGTGDQLVTHEEKPVDVQSANPPPRVVTTIPVISNSTGMPSPASSPPLAPPPATAAPAVPSAPGAGPVGSSAPPPGVAGINKPAQPAAAMEQLTSPMPPPSGSKPVHTVVIRPNQATNAAPPPHSQPTPVPRPVTAHQPMTRPAREVAPRTASAGPLSLVPNQEEAAPRRPEPREQTATARSEPMSLTSRPATEAVPPRGGYAVQVASQRSEAEAMASFRSLQAKYPQQLGDHHAIIRRADLGAKGIYFRALIGPFASAAEAASLCSSLKAAGGTCLIQRN